jgi:hypothetical protein
MFRRNFIKGISMLPGLAVFNQSLAKDIVSSSADTRRYWLDTLLHISRPVLTALSQNQLKERMPVETKAGAEEERKKFSHLEALGRTLAGLAPWLELDDDNETENKWREEYIALSIASIKNATTPSAKDYLNFNKNNQPLVDAAFLAHALIRAPKNLWARLDEETQRNVLTALRSTRIIKPYYSNWLLFAAMIETALLKFDNEYDPMRIDYALQEHQNWYKGDGLYGDGPDFHFDYYNSYVIQPMLIDVVKNLNEKEGKTDDLLATIVKRAQRYAEIQERLISPEGTFPVTGRSIAYRCGAFQLLAQIALQKKLPPALTPAQVREALTAVIQKTIDAPDTFDRNGWLMIGLAGHQPEIGERYISTGSLYLCTTAFLPLGLSAKDEFWSAPAEAWTSKKAFSGKVFPIDQAMKD